MIINLITAAVSGKIQTRPRRADRAGYNGNLVLYDPGFDYGAWNHNTTNKGTDLYFQGDGNLLVYQSSITVWKSGTSDPHHGGKDGRKLELTPRGSLYILDQEGKVIWRGR